MKIQTMFSLIACLFSINSAYASEQNFYSIIVDAGSSGSRLHIFQNDTTPALPIIQDIFTEKSSTPLASFASHPQDAGASLKPLLDDAIKYFSDHNIPAHNIKIRILGTAGMRLLNKKSQVVIYQNIRNYIATNYSPTLQIADTRTITGKEESLFDWLDVNYLENTFANHTNTFGSIDMGGASTQLAFATKNITDPKNEKHLVVNGQNYIVFVKSFLGLGEDQARYSMNTYPLAGTCYPSGYTLSDTVTGNFIFPTCTNIYNQLIDGFNVSKNILPIDPQQKIIAFSGIYYRFKFFGVDTTPNQNIVETQINTVCAETWDQMKINYPTTSESDLSTECAMGTYVDDLLFNYYHLHDNQLIVSNTINSKGVDWTLGAMLYSLL